MSKQPMDTPKKHETYKPTFAAFADGTKSPLSTDYRFRLVLFLTNVHRPFDLGAWTGYLIALFQQEGWQINDFWQSILGPVVLLAERGF